MLRHTFAEVCGCFFSLPFSNFQPTEYNITLRYPDLPLVDVGGQKANLLPPEVCEILPNQPYKLKLNTDQTDKMLSIAARPPNVNANDINGVGLDRLGFRSRASPLGTFGVSIGTEMTVVPGRILEAPTLQYGAGGSSPPINEKASWNLRGVKFAVGAKVTRWAVLVLSDGSRSDFQGPNDPNLRATVDGLVRMCNTSGMNVSQSKQDPMFVGCQLPQKSKADPVREKAIAKINNDLMSLPGKPTFVLVMLSSSDKHIYSGLKHLCDVKLGIPTVCVQSSQVAKRTCSCRFEILICSSFIVRKSPILRECCAQN